MIEQRQRLSAGSDAISESGYQFGEDGSALGGTGAVLVVLVALWPLHQLASRGPRGEERRIDGLGVLLKKKKEGNIKRKIGCVHGEVWACDAPVGFRESSIIITRPS